MSLADWTNLYGGQYFSLSSDHVYEGSKALKIQRSNYAKGGKVLTQSITDSPTKGNIETYGYMSTLWSAIGFLFRATDSNNYYIASFSQRDDTRVFFQLYRWVSGASTYLGSPTITGININTWYLFKVMFCEIGGTIYAEGYIDGVLKETLTDGSPAHAGGGGIGVAAPKEAGTTGYAWIDLTKVYY